MALFFGHAKGILETLMATYVDDSLITENEEFEDETLSISKRFETKPRIFMNSQIAGIYMEKLGKEFKIHQKEYVERLKELDRHSHFKDFRSSRSQLLCFTHTRLDISTTTNNLQQVKESRIVVENFKIFNNVIRILKKT